MVGFSRITFFTVWLILFGWNCEFLLFLTFSERYEACPGCLWGKWGLIFLVSFECFWGRLINVCCGWVSLVMTETIKSNWYKYKIELKKEKDLKIIPFDLLCSACRHPEFRKLQHHLSRFDLYHIFKIIPTRYTKLMKRKKHRIELIIR